MSQPSQWTTTYSSVFRDRRRYEAPDSRPSDDSWNVRTQGYYGTRADLAEHATRTAEVEARTQYGSKPITGAAATQRMNSTGGAGANTGRAGFNGGLSGSVDQQQNVPYGASVSQVKYVHPQKDLWVSRGTRTHTAKEDATASWLHLLTGPLSLARVSSISSPPPPFSPPPLADSPDPAAHRHRARQHPDHGRRRRVRRDPARVLPDRVQQRIRGRAPVDRRPAAAAGTAAANPAGVRAAVAHPGMYVTPLGTLQRRRARRMFIGGARMAGSISLQAC